MIGMKDTIEVINAAGTVAAVVIKHLKKSEGIGKEAIDIATELMGSEAFKAELALAIADIGKVPAEISDFNLMEDAPPLAVAGWQVISKIIDAIKS